MSTGSLWGEIPDIANIRTPYEILVEQGNYLIEMTNEMLNYDIDRQQKKTLFTYEFAIIVPSVGCQQTVFRVTHDIKLYPAILFDEQTGEEYTSNNQDDFEKDLGAILASEEIRVIITGLLAQSRLDMQ